MSTKKLSGHLDVVGDVPGQQFLNAIDGMIRNARQHFPQVSFGIEVIEFGAADQAVDCCGSLSAGIGAGEKVVLSTYRDRTQSPLGRVIVDLQVTIVAVTRQGIPQPQRIADRGGGV